MDEHDEPLRFLAHMISLGAMLTRGYRHETTRAHAHNAHAHNAHTHTVHTAWARQACILAQYLRGTLCEPADLSCNTLVHSPPPLASPHTIVQQQPQCTSSSVFVRCDVAKRTISETRVTVMTYACCE